MKRGGLDTKECEAIRDFKHVLAGRGRRYAIIGALARLVLLDWPFHRSGERSTKDVDLVVEVATWNEYEAVLLEFESTGVFLRGPSGHSLTHRPTGTKFDLVPFGAVANGDNRLVWPKDQRVMSTDGLAESAAIAEEEIEVAPGLRMPVVPLHALVVLKLFAYRDRGIARDDLRDINHVLRHCITEDIFAEVAEALAPHFEELGLEDFHEEAGAAWLGLKIKRDYSASTRLGLCEILNPLASDPYHEHTQNLVSPSLDAKDRDAALASIGSRFLILRRAIDPCTHLSA